MKRLLKMVNTKTARSTGFYFVGNFFLNIFRYLFHLILLRYLTPPEYGEYLSYLSLMYILAIPTGTLSSIVTKTVADYEGKGDTGATNALFYYLVKKSTLVGLAVGLVLILMANSFANLFKAHPLAFIVLGVSTFISLFQTIIGSFLAAFQKFTTQTILGFVNATLTILISVILIQQGFGPTGAVIGQIVSGLIVSALTIYQIRAKIYPKIKNVPETFPSLKKFTLYSFIFNLGSMSLISLDVLIVRALFDTHTSGLYSSLSILGRMILFGLSPLVGLVLPMAAIRHSQRGNPSLVFLKLGSLIFIFGSIAVLLFSTFPNLVITLLSGKQYLPVSHLLSTFSVSMLIFALSQFILSYLIATNREKSNLVYLFFAVLQPILLYKFGNTIENIVNINLSVQLCLFIVLVAYLLSPKLTLVKFLHGQKG